MKSEVVSYGLKLRLFPGTGLIPGVRDWRELFKVPLLVLSDLSETLLLIDTLIDGYESSRASEQGRYSPFFIRDLRTL